VIAPAHYRIRVERAAVRKGSGRRSMALLVVASVTAVAIAAMPAAAAPGSLSLSLSTVAQAVKSVTVTPTSDAYTSCIYGSSSGSNLGFPRGACTSLPTGVTVTNGTTPALILVNGADMVPSDSGTHWTLQSGPVTTADHYYETVSSNDLYNSGASQGGVPFLALSNTAACESIFLPACGNSNAGQSAIEFPGITGPQTSSDTSSSWTTSITWTAS